jgi:hypothetical protein
MRALSRTLALLACATLAPCACQPADRQEPLSALAIAIVVHAQTPSGDPVADLHAWADGRELGVTRADGDLDAPLRGREGQRVALSFACPVTHRTLDPRRELVLRTTQPLEGSKPAALAVAVRCAPIEHFAAVVVRASGPAVAGLPVLVQGEPLARVARDGTAHVLVRVGARQPLRVMLDTRAAPQLRPANPVQTFELRDEDRLVLFEQRFGAVARTPPTRPPPRARPYRID